VVPTLPHDRPVDRSPGHRVLGPGQGREAPTLLVFKAGQVVDQQIGAVPQPRIAAMLERQLDAVAGSRTA
jgi:hypothetical protein